MKVYLDSLKIIKGERVATRRATIESTMWTKFVSFQSKKKEWGRGHFLEIFQQICYLNSYF